MTDWREVKLGDVAKFSQGIQVPIEKQSLIPFENSVRFIRIVDLTNPNEPKRYISNPGERYIISENDLAMVRYGSPGLPVLGMNGAIANNLFRIIPNNLDEIYPKYLFYYFLIPSIQNYLLTVQPSSTMPSITFNVMKNMSISLPSLGVQRKIAGVLGVLDDKIELNNKINQNLELQAQALILDYIQHTEEKMPLGNLITFTNGFAFKSSDYLPSGTYKIITIKNVQDGSVDSQGASCLDELPEKLSKDCCLCIGDVLLSLTGNVGRVGIVTEENLLLNQRVAKINSKDSLLPFVYFYMRLPAMKTEMENISKGTAQQNLSPVETLKLEISFDREKATELSQTLKTFYDELIFNTIQNQNLTELRDTLLPKLMSGEIDVDKVDISELPSADKLSFNEVQQ